MQRTTHTISDSLDRLMHSHLVLFASLYLSLTWVAWTPAQAQTTNYTLGTTNLLVGPAVGSNSVVLGVSPLAASWTASTNDTWLHLSAANQSGTDNANVIFSYDANIGPTRTGTLTIAGQTVNVTQAGSTYVAAGILTTLVSSGLSPWGLAVDGAGNVYVADTGHKAIKEWMPLNNSVTTLVSSGLSDPQGLALDRETNVYIADSSAGAIYKWTSANGNLTAVVSSGLSYPGGVALDSVGNIYFITNSAIEKWRIANGNVTLVVSSGVNNPSGLAVDEAGNVYIANTLDNNILKWSADHKPLLISGLAIPWAVAVDGSGNVYIANSAGNSLIEWTASDQSVVTLPATGLSGVMGMAVDGSGNIYISDTFHNSIKELPRAFVDATPKLETLSAGSDSLPVVLPVTANLLPPFAPFTDQPWLAITGITNGVVNFAFAASTSNRTASITLLGQTIFVTQGGPNYSLGASALVEGPDAGLDSVVLAVLPLSSSWTNQANASWLHLSQANQYGGGSTNVIFSFDANPGATRTGTLTVAGQTITVTQAGSTYVPVDSLTPLVPSGVQSSAGLGVDGAGGVYFFGTNSTIYEWTPSDDSVSIVVSSVLLSNSTAMTVDNAGDVYVAGGLGDSVYKWTADSSNFSQLFSLAENSVFSIPIFPVELALDTVGDVYIAYYLGIAKWTAADNSLSQFINNTPVDVAADVAGNVYYTGFGTASNFFEWLAANNTTIEFGLPEGALAFNLAVDGSGNVYFSGGEGPVMKWTAANGNFTALVPDGVIKATVDGAGNKYCLIGNSIGELPHDFMDPTPKLEGLAAGSDTLPAVVPATANLLPPFAPTSDQPWLTITEVTNGVVSFSFTTNSGPARTANITLLGQTIPITQGTIGMPTVITGVQLVNSNMLQFGFTNSQTASLTVLCSSNLSLPFGQWTVVGSATNIGPGQFQFTTQPGTNGSQLFYIIRSP